MMKDHLKCCAPMCIGTVRVPKVRMELPLAAASAGPPAFERVSKRVAGRTLIWAPVSMRKRLPEILSKQRGGCPMCRPPWTLLTAGLPVFLPCEGARGTALARSVAKTLMEETEAGRLGGVVWTNVRQTSPCKFRPEFTDVVAGGVGGMLNGIDA